MHHPKHVQACVWLVAATAFWGLSFPFIRASWLLQKQLAPEISSFSFAAVLTVIRFGVAGLLIALFSPRSLRSVTALEFEQGWKMGIVSGLGIVFQMDGLAHTEASTSAFLTQFTCLLIPLWVAWRKRALPQLGVIVSCVMVLAGVAVLAHFDWRHFRMGRGEGETLLSAVFFSAQILLLEQPRYAPNRVNTFTIVMFVTTTTMLALVAALTSPPAPASLWS